VSFSFAQKFRVALFLAVAKIIWAIDCATGPVTEFFSALILKSGVLLSCLFLMLLIVFSAKTGYLKNIADGVVSWQSPIYSSGSTDVLGTESVFALYPVETGKTLPPVTTAKGVLVMDKKYIKTLYQKNEWTRLAPASTTKLMTALVTLDLYKVNETVVVPKDCTEIDSTKAGLPIGEEFRVLDLVNAMLVASAGDAACTLTEGKVSAPQFVSLMNQKAGVLGMVNTNFTNAVGLDAENGAHYSTVADLYKLSLAAMKSSQIQNAVKQKELFLKSIDEKYIGKLETTNRLLNEIPQSIGIKTGTTTDAGEVLIYEYQDEVKDLVIIVMGSSDRFSDVRALLYWVLTNYRWK
jgi:serine-type D-Ala-D-Ala carboxypeptidase (penicillin-binding protein 5/6)